MENHPIPQDVTGFQFRLIGSLTVKQFGYLAAAAVLFVICWYLPIAVYIKGPLLLLFAGFGIGLAFIPIEGRPMDVMAGHFLEDVFAANQYVYQKTGGHLAISTVTIHKTTPLMPLPIGASGTTQPKKDKGDKSHHEKEEKLKAFLDTIHAKTRNKLDEKEMKFLQSLFSVSDQEQADLTALPQKKIVEEKKTKQHPHMNPQQLEQVLAKEAQMLQQEIQAAQLNEQKQHSPEKARAVHENVVGLEQQLQNIMLEKQQLERELMRLKQELTSQQQRVYTASTAQPAALQPQVMQQTLNVRNIPKTMAKSVGFPYTPDTPNVLVGIVKDARGNVLPGILVEVQDKDGNPIRAFKTNGLGQFASATALNNGVYTIHFEDPKEQHRFDIVQLEAKNEIILPIEVISHDAREELRKELFNEA